MFLSFGRFPEWHRSAFFSRHGYIGCLCASCRYVAVKSRSASWQRRSEPDLMSSPGRESAARATITGTAFQDILLTTGLSGVEVQRIRTSASQKRCSTVCAAAAHEELRGHTVGAFGPSDFGSKALWRNPGSPPASPSASEFCRFSPLLIMYCICSGIFPYQSALNPVQPLGGQRH